VGATNTFIEEELGRFCGDDVFGVLDTKDGETGGLSGDY